MDRFLLLAMLLLLTYITRCQSVLKTGDPSIRYELIRPDVTHYKIVTTDSAGKTLSEFTCLHTIAVNKTRGWVILTQEYQFPDGRILLDSTIANLHTLSPVRMRMVTTPHFMKMDLDFRAREVHAIADKGGRKTDTLHKMEEGYFDSNLLEYLFGLLPYKKGFSATINAYTFEQHGMDPWKVEYIGEDMLTTTGGPAWCYVAKTGNAGNITDMMTWIEKSSGKVLKRVIPLGKMYYIITKI
ncbi:hypothetical protein HB364_11160 [Pseudoflavitalea sp. X16]|uniref:DUF3108 domain-containing protein n=1 Tax=Paraflavitalea devenefica TaxID=2716334 RepID=UPI001420E5AD|nr:hypothetical protein [Paraflavitalea devenefica]NII25645.1 hypothetical protein [Paraflavitalea devenefica]